MTGRLLLVAGDAIGGAVTIALTLAAPVVTYNRLVALNRENSEASTGDTDSTAENADAFAAA